MALGPGASGSARALEPVASDRYLERNNVDTLTGGIAAAVSVCFRIHQLGRMVKSKLLGLAPVTIGGGSHILDIDIAFRM
jgi:hypothetical protein